MTRSRIASRLGRARARMSRTAAVIRGRRLARFHMARVLCSADAAIAEAREILEAGATPERIERAALELSSLGVRQGSLL